MVLMKALLLLPLLLRPPPRSLPLLMLRKLAGAPQPPLRRRPRSGHVPLQSASVLLRKWSAPLPSATRCRHSAMQRKMH